LLGKSDSNEPVELAQAKQFFGRFGWEGIDKETFSEICLKNAISYCDLPGLLLAEKTNSHHLMFRSRFHFSHKALFHNNFFGFGPLFSPSLLKAVRGLPQEERISGRAMFDVTRTMCERLPHFPFAKPFDRKYFESRYHKPSRYDGTELELPDGLPLLEAGKAITRRAQARNRFPISRLNRKKRRRFLRVLRPQPWKSCALGRTSSDALAGRT
jgi:hypothetical protein